MKHRIVVLSILIVAALAVWFFDLAIGQGDFHSPQTDAEKQLDHVIKRAEADDYAFDNMLGRVDVVPQGERVDYSSMLTQKLVASWIEEEVRLVAEQCGGRYIPGELCGMESNPLTCMQDIADQYFYKTIEADDDSVMIEYGWALSGKAAARYGLVKEGGVWKIDFVECAP